MDNNKILDEEGDSEKWSRGLDWNNEDHENQNNDDWNNEDLTPSTRITSEREKQHGKNPFSSIFNKEASQENSQATRPVKIPVNSRTDEEVKVEMDRSNEQIEKRDNSNIMEEFRILRLNHASTLTIESKECQELYDKIMNMGQERIESLIESKSLGLKKCENMECLTKNEIIFRKCLYNLMFKNPNSNFIKIEKIVDPLNGSRLSTSIGRPVFTLKYKKISDAENMDDDELMNGSTEDRLFPIVLGVLWGVIRDVELFNNRLVLSNNNNKKRLLPRLDWLLGFEIGTHPSISFCSIIKPNRHVIDCSLATSPVFFVNHYKSLWESINKEILLKPNNQTSEMKNDCIEIPSPTTSMFNTSINEQPQGFMESIEYPNCRFHVVSILGFPFLVLTSIPGLELIDDCELIVDKGKNWEDQRRNLDWPLLWNEFVSNRANCKIQVSNEIQRFNFCDICYKSIFNNSSMSDSLTCDGCHSAFHVKCLKSFYEINPLPNMEWYCNKCREFAERVLGNPGERLNIENQPGIQEQFVILLRGDDSPLKRLKSCSRCASESTDKNINIKCRLFKRHLSQNALDTNKEGNNDYEYQGNNDYEYQGENDYEYLRMSKFIIETMTSALTKSERRNYEMQKQIRDLQNKCLNGELSPQEVKTAIDFWRSTRQKFELFQKRQSEIVPEISVCKPSQPANFFLKETPRTTRDSNQIRRHSGPSIQAVLSDIESNCMDGKMSDDNSSQTSNPRIRSSVGTNCRPQIMARSLLRDEFEPGKAAACIDNPISFNEANATAKRLRPWPRGISWNSKRLTWSVRFWKDDGKTLIATSIPARKHGGVEEAFRKACALRNRSFIHVLARIATDCQSEGRDLTNLRWSRSNHHWKAEHDGDVKVWSAETEEDVKSTWRNAVRWLASRNDANAAEIDTDVVERFLPSSATIRSSRITNRHHCMMGDTEDDEEEETSGNITITRRTRRRTSNDMPADEEEEETRVVVDINNTEDYSKDQDFRRHSTSIASLLPFPPGLIWARTTSRFFAVFRDPQSSSINRKKRFKTFDPKKFGGVNGGFNAACEFLGTVEPWETKSNLKNAQKKKRGRKPTEEKKDEYTELYRTETSQIETTSQRNSINQNDSTLPTESIDDEDVAESMTDIESIDKENKTPIDEELQLLPSCDAIQWCQNENEFLATSEDGKTKRFALKSGALCAWHEAFQWVEEQKEKTRDVYFRESENKRQNTRRSRLQQFSSSVEFNEGENSMEEQNNTEFIEENNLETCEEGTAGETENDVRITKRRQSSEIVYGELENSEESDDIQKIPKRKPRKRKLRESEISTESKVVCRHGADYEDSDSQMSSAHKRLCNGPYITGLSSNSISGNSSSYTRLGNYVSKIEEEHLYESEDSQPDMNEQAKRLQKFNNISWVPQKQAFSVFYSKDITSHNKTTKAFNPIYYHGVKRAYKQACIFGLRMLERKLFFKNGTISNDEELTPSHQS